MSNQHPACSDKNPDFAFDLGTSPHGLSAELLLPVQETCGVLGSLLPVDQQAPKGRAVGLLSKGGPEVRIRRAGRSIQGAAVRQARELHALELSEREFVLAYLAIEHDRNRTRKAIGKGLAAPQDLKATDSLWRKLQDVMAQRMKGGRK